MDTFRPKVNGSYFIKYDPLTFGLNVSICQNLPVWNKKSAQCSPTNSGQERQCKYYLMMCISHRNIIQPVIEKFLLNDMKLKDIRAFSSMFSLRIGPPIQNILLCFRFEMENLREG